jgi:hypothetical protein
MLACARHRLSAGACAGLFALLALSSARAQTSASLPYTPSAALRHHIQRLIDEAGLPLLSMQWPLPALAVRDALDTLPAELPDALAASRDAVRADLVRSTRADVALQLRTRSDTLVGFGDNYTPGSSASAHSPELSTGGAWVARAGARVEEEPSSDDPWSHDSTIGRLDDSALVAQTLGVNLQAFSHGYWWGPGWQSSLVLGNNAPQWLGVGLQRASVGPSTSPWLSWLGPWSFETFVARAQDPLVVAQQPQGFLMSGMRLGFKPHPLVEIGLTRTLQTAGRGRPHGLHNFVRALLGIGVNADTPEQQASDPGNEMAGYDLRVRCGGALRCAGYMQLIGEDQGGIMPSKFLSLFGTEAWSADGSQRWFAEYALTYCSLPWQHEQPNCAYRNGQYPQGYTNGTRWSGASQGPDSRLLTLGWLSTEGERQIRLHLGRVGTSLGAFSPTAADPPRGRLIGFSAQTSLAWQGLTWSPALSWAHLSEGSDTGIHRRNSVQLGVQARWSLP